jgi:hypothetical protein
MHCPACNTDAPDGSTACPNCQATLPPPKRKRRRRGEPDESLDPARVAAYERQVRGLLGLVAASALPFLGLVLGPLTVGLVARLLRKGRRDPAFTARRAARQELAFALVCTAVQWVGLALMLAGLRGG